jgi:EmrB/QacA subfamily drug resistance transporter
MVVLDATVVNIALPSAQQALHFSDSDRQWIVTAYSLAFGSLLLLGGRIADLFGRKRVFVVGLLGFAGASALGGAASSFDLLVAARALQGAFGALLAPAALSLLSTTFTAGKERSKAFGIYGAIAGAGGAIGLLLGGILTEYLSWRWAMYVNLAFALPAALGALALIHDGPRAASRRIDIPGALIASSGLFSLVYGFSRADTDGWADPLTLGLLAAAAVLLAVFVLVERRVAEPLLPLRVVRDRTRGGSYLAVAVAGAGMFGVFLFLTFYLQTTLGYSPVRTGLAFLPMVASLMVAAAISTTRIFPRVGPRPLVTVGMAFAAAGMILLTGVGIDTGYVTHVLPGLIVMGLGIGMIMAPSMNSATAGVGNADAGVASAMVSTGQQIGGSIGAALLNTLASAAAASFVTTHGPSAATMTEAAVHGYTTAFWWAAAIFGVGSVLAGVILPSGAPAAAPEGELVMAH